MKKSRAKARPDSVLKRQKPKGKGPRWARATLYKVLTGTALAGVFSFLVYRGAVLSSKPAAVGAAEREPVWQFSLKLKEDLPLSDSAQDQIIATARAQVASGSRAELTKAALAIQKLDSYADVRLVKIAGDRIAISVAQRHPALCIEADRWRYVSTQGDVYGQVAEGQGSSCPGPTLTGVFDRGRRLVVADDLTVVLSDEERAIIKESVELLGDARAKGITLAKLEVRRYRGFFAQILPQSTEVALGRAPFAPKFDKLQGILEKLAKKNEQAARIELDYQGKAFIKLKKM